MLELQTVDEFKYFYNFEKVDTYSRLFEFMVGKTIDRIIQQGTLEYERFESGWAIVMFTDKTGFLYEIDWGWGGSDSTPGDPTEVATYILTPKTV